MPLILKQFLLLLGSVVYFPGVKAQTDLRECTVINYNSDNALPQNSINAMAFDKNGFLWMGTEMGIVRFDGKVFREYNMENTPALPQNRCLLINAVDHGNKILIQPQLGVPYALTVSDDYQLVRDSLISGDPHYANVWFSAPFHYNTIYRKQELEENAGKYRLLLKGLPANLSLATVNETQAYVQEGANCYFLDEATGDIQLLKEVSGYTPKLRYVVGDVFVYVDSANRVYAYRKAVLQREIKASASLHGIFVQGGTSDSMRLARDNLHTFLCCMGNIMIATLKNNELGYEMAISNTPFYDVNALIYDEAEKTFYIGTATSGLYVVKRHDFKTLRFASTRYAVNSLYAQVEMRPGQMLTASGILDRDNINNLAFRETRDIDRRVMLHASDGSIWFSQNRYLVRSDSNFPECIKVRFIGTWLSAIIETEEKDIIYSNPDQVVLMHGQKETLLVDHAEAMKNAEISALGMIDSDRLWIGTSGGLYEYNMRSRVLIKMKSLENDYVRTIYKAKDGSVWIGTYGQGFYKCYENQFVKMPMDARNNLATAHCFMEDNNGYFWIPTNRGLFKVAKKELDDYASGRKGDVFYFYYDKSYGFTSDEFNGGCTPCGLLTSDHLFSLPTLDGLVQFNPDSIRSTFPRKPIFIDHIIADGKQLLWRDNVKIDPHFHQLIFEISAPWFGNQANLHLEYSIEELGKNWYPVNADRKITLTGLGKGRYTLVLRKQDGYNAYSYKTIHFTILPFWYETNWFMIIAVLAAVFIFLFYFRVRYNVQLNKGRLLEEKITTRTQELSVTVEELEKTNEVKEKMISIILHDFRSPLRFLQLLARHVHDNFKRVNEQELSGLLLRFRYATNELYDFAQDFLLWINTQKDGFVVKQEKIVLHRVITEIIALYETGANINRNRVINLVPENITLTTDLNILKLIIRNLTDNANKYTLDGVIKIDAVGDNSSVVIIITDTGHPIDKSTAEKIIQNDFGQVSSGQGLGYKIITELLVKINGSISIEPSGLPPGNRVCIVLKTGAETAEQRPAL